MTAVRLLATRKYLLSVQTLQGLAFSRPLEKYLGHPEDNLLERYHEKKSNSKKNIASKMKLGGLPLLFN